MTQGAKRSRFERLLDLPERAVNSLRISNDAKMVLVGLVRFVKQIIRSKKTR